MIWYSHTKSNQVFWISGIKKGTSLSAFPTQKCPWNLSPSFHPREVTSFDDPASTIPVEVHFVDAQYHPPLEVPNRQKSHKTSKEKHLGKIIYEFKSCFWLFGAFARLLPPLAMFQVCFVCSSACEEMWLADVEFKLQSVKLGNQLDRLQDDRTAALEAIASIQAPWRANRMLWWGWKICGGCDSSPKKDAEKTDSSWHEYDILRCMLP